jgi:MFS transporter, Spinster family, sphingosine-1-phosphate transporter
VPAKPPSSPNSALVLLLVINLFNYVDRQILAAVLPLIKSDLHIAQGDIGWCATAFLLSYMLLSPLFGVMADRMSRWVLIAIGVGVWSLASGGTGLAMSFAALIATRCVVGVGEAAYGPVAPTLLSDLYPQERRGQILSWFYLAIPVGSALGYVLGGAVASALNWRWAFWLVLPPGLLLAVWSMLMRDPPRGLSDHAAPRRAKAADYLSLARNRSYVLDTLGMAAMTFAVGGVGFWMPTYIDGLGTAGGLARINLIFGGIVVVSGLVATLLGGWAGDRLRRRYPGAYFLVCGGGLMAGVPMFLLMLWTPFPWAWIFVFLACFCLFFNTGPGNAILANVTHPSIRATAFAVNILIIHVLGDAISPMIIGKIADRWSLQAGFAVMSGMMAVGAVVWLCGARYLEADTLRAGSGE